MDRGVLVRLPARDEVLAVRILRAAGVEAEAGGREAEVIARLPQGVGVLLVAEELLTEPVAAALQRYAEQERAWSDLPVLVLARQGADSPQAQSAVERLGNVTMLERPVRTLTLVSAVRSALRARERQYEIRALSRRKDEFLATLAHELRNPLAPIRNAMAILERLHPTPRVASLAGMVDRQVSHLTRLVDDLLDVARITSGKLQLQLTATTVARVVTHAMEIAQAGFDARQQRVRVEQPDREIELRADHVRLVQSLANLLVNASKFTPAGGHIDLQVRIDGQWVEFAVSDDGRGLQPQELERIFEMFEQAHGVGEPTGGLGLGLHLTRAFAQLHGGTVRASSRGPGCGSEFLLRLPVVLADAAGPADPAAGAGPQATLALRVLVVDDNVDAAESLQALLALHGVPAAVAHDGAAAVAAVREQGPDVVVMDIGMPVMNGYEAARRIRAEAALAAPVLIALTGWGQYADKARALEAGFDHHFVKPVTIDQLMACLAGVERRQPGAAQA
jgi:signal transduction histidine kinase/ActR/RegA family two-component response regulator